MNIELAYGKSKLPFSLDKSKLLGVIKENNVPCIENDKVNLKIREGIKKFIKKEDFSKQKITILVPDRTRLWTKGNIFIPQIVEFLLEGGARIENIKIIVGTGAHRPCLPKEFPLLVGEELIGRVKIKSHYSSEMNRMSYLGETSRGTPIYINKEVVESDCIILFGGVMLHLLAGFGGGRKMILPGVSANITVQKNHSLALTNDGSPNPMVSQTILEGNPVNEDMIEGARLLLKDKRSLLINIATNTSGEVFYLAMGDWLESWLDACREVEKAGKVYIKKRADFVIVSAGGYEKDGQLYQSTKALFNIIDSVKEGGEIIFISECREGVGNDEFDFALKKFNRKGKNLGKKLLEKFSMPSYVAFRVIDILNKFKVTLVSNINSNHVDELGFYCLKSLEGLNGLIENLKGKGYIIPSGENVLPIFKK